MLLMSTEPVVVVVRLAALTRKGAVPPIPCLPALRLTVLALTESVPVAATSEIKPVAVNVMVPLAKLPVDMFPPIVIAPAAFRVITLGVIALV